MRIAFGRLLLAAACALAALATACGGPPSVNPPNQIQSDDTGADNVATPSLIAVSPTTWTAGTTIKVIGGDFIAPSKGKVFVRFVGTFTGQGGGSGDVDMELQATYRAANKVDFVFEADAPPSGFGLSVGSFTGKVTVTNVSSRGKEVKSQPLTTRVDVGPSIVVNRVAPYSQSCADNRVKGVLNGDLVDIDLTVTGLGAGSAYAPIAITAAYVDVTAAPRVVDDSITDGSNLLLTIDPGSMPDGGDTAEAINDARTSRDVGVSITATDGNGHSIQRQVVFTVHMPFEVVYDGNVQVVEVFQPQAVTGCLPGGMNGNSFNYSEGTSEGRSRGYSLSGNFGVSVWILSLGFGFGVSSSVSSGTSSGLGISHGVFPHWFGAFFRQTSKLLRTGTIVRYDSCGMGNEVGEAYVTDWTWAPGFNQKNGDCPPLPEPLLSPAGSVEVSQ